MKKYLPWILLGVGLMAIDQASKLWVKLYLGQEVVEIFDEFFRFIYSENFGIAFSIPIPLILLIAFNTFLICLLPWMASKELNISSKITLSALTLVIAGGLGNLIDRFVWGFVVDFISIWKYPIFNIADIYIFVGVFLVIICYGKIKRIEK